MESFGFPNEGHKARCLGGCIIRRLSWLLAGSTAKPRDNYAQ